MPVAAAFSFGSFGDIISLVSLILQVRRALGDSSGASKDHQALVAELDSFSDLLHIVCDALSVQDSSRRLPESVRNAISHGVQSSTALLEGFYKDMEKYRDTLREGGSGSVIRDSWMKVEWALFRNEDVRDMRRKLAEQVGRLNALLSVSYWHALECVEEVCREHRIALVEVSRRMEELPRSLGYPWAVQRPVQLRHILGQDINLPMDLFTTPEAFDDFLKFFFKNRPGRRFVDRRDYDLSTSDGDMSVLVVIIKVAEWKEKVKPGATIDMNAIVHRTMHAGESRSRACPSCDRTIDSSVLVDVSLQCAFCQTWYIISAKQDENHTFETHNDLSSTGSSRKSFEDNKNPDDDLKFLRRIRIVELRLKRDCDRDTSPDIVESAHAGPPFVDHTAASVAKCTKAELKEMIPNIVVSTKEYLDEQEVSTPQSNAEDGKGACSSETCPQPLAAPTLCSIEPPDATSPSARIHRQKPSTTPSLPPRADSPTSIYSDYSVHWAPSTLALRPSEVNSAPGYPSLGLPNLPRSSRIRRRRSNATFASSAPSGMEDDYRSDADEVYGDRAPRYYRMSNGSTMEGTLSSLSRTCVTSGHTSQNSLIKKLSQFRRSSQSLNPVDINANDGSRSHDRVSDVDEETESPQPNVEQGGDEVVVRKVSRIARILSFLKRRRTASHVNQASMEHQSVQRL